MMHSETPEQPEHDVPGSQALSPLPAMHGPRQRLTEAQLFLDRIDWPCELIGDELRGVC